jgi:hypothetical protein
MKNVAALEVNFTQRIKEKNVHNNLILVVFFVTLVSLYHTKNTYKAAL